MNFQPEKLLRPQTEALRGLLGLWVWAWQTNSKIHACLKVFQILKKCNVFASSIFAQQHFYVFTLIQNTRIYKKLFLFFTLQSLEELSKIEKHFLSGAKWRKITLTFTLSSYSLLGTGGLDICWQRCYHPHTQTHTHTHTHTHTPVKMI